MGLKFKIPGTGGKHGNPLDPSHALDLIKKAEQSAVGKISDAAAAELKKIEQQGKDRLYDITYNGNNYLGAIKKEGEAIKNALPGDVEDLLKKGLEEALEEFFAILSKGFLDRYIKLLDVAAPDGAWPTIGPVALAINDIRSKIDSLKKWAKNPPHDKDSLKQFIIELGPDQVWVTLTVSVPGTDSLKAGGQLFWITENFLDRLDTLWNELKL